MLNASGQNTLGSEGATSGNGQDKQHGKQATAGPIKPEPTLQADQKPTNVVGAIFNILDTPLVDLARCCLPEKTRSARIPGNNTLDASDYNGAKPTFSPIKVESYNTASQQIDSSTQSMTKCFKSALSWAWKASPAYFITGIVSASMAATLPYLVSYTSAKVIDSIISVSKTQDMNYAVGAFNWLIAGSIVGLGIATISLVSNYVKTKHDPLTEAKRKNDIRQAFSGFSPAEHLTPEVQQLTNRTLQAQWALQNFGNAISESVVPAVSTIGALFILAPYSAIGAGLMGMFAIPYLYHAYKRGQDELKTSEAYSAANTKFSTREWCTLSGASGVEVALNNKREALLEHLEKEQSNFLERTNEPAYKKLKRDPWVVMLNYVATAGIGFSLLTDVVAGISANNPSALSIGLYGLVVGALFTLNSSVNTLSNNVGSVLTALPLAKLAHAVIDKGMTKKIENKPPFKFNSAPALEIKNLGLTYPATGEKPAIEAIKGLNLKIHAGELVVIVGESGKAGKSSLLNVLCGLYDPTSGEVLFNSQSITEHDKRSLWEQSSYLRQESTLLIGMTIRDNIALGARRDLTDDEIIEITKETGFYDIMTRANLTLDTVMGEWLKDGHKFSGGQNTIFCMTRQAATGAKFMVLDEPTANLDQLLTQQVLERIKNLTGTTRVVVAHDIGVAASVADRVIVVEEGAVIATGKHNELLVNCGAYKKLYYAQLERLISHMNEDDLNAFKLWLQLKNTTQHQS